MGAARLLLSSIMFMAMAIWTFLYYTGRTNYSGQEELIRKEKVRRFGWFFIVAIVGFSICSLGLFLSGLRVMGYI